MTVWVRLRMRDGHSASVCALRIAGSRGRMRAAHSRVKKTQSNFHFGGILFIRHRLFWGDVLEPVMKRIIWLVMAISSLVGACEANTNTEMAANSDNSEPIAVRQLPIINGKRVTGNDRLSTVALVIHYSNNNNVAFCTGTLISPKYVLTAGHCTSECDGTNPMAYLSMIRVAIGQSESQFTKTYEIEAVYTHPDFICSGSGTQWMNLNNDISILKLKKAVPISDVTPTMVISPNLDMTPSEVDAGNVNVTAAGFGLTNANIDSSSGTKYETNMTVYAYCPGNRKRSNRCSNSFTRNHFLYTYSNTTGTCQGDSGGPLFWKKNGIEYVVGVTSYGAEGCLTYSAFTIVSDYYDFITSHVDDLAAALPENCNNNVDDNNDGRIDCDDPYCFGIPRCIPEDCGNGRDDNGDGLTDCNAPECFDAIVCQPEICDDKIDNNGNEYVDCNDPECYNEPICQPEICDNGIDDNYNGDYDCDDEQCRNALICQPEICDNGIDDNGNDQIDCDDAQCERSPVCLPEICDNNVDDNGDKLIDCSDPKCRTATVCQPENCQDNIDNNGNNLVDCQDPQCAMELRCQPEICDDDQDNNGDGLKDCADPQCEQNAACHSESAPSSYTANPQNTGIPGAGWLAVFGLMMAGIGTRRKHRTIL